MSFTTHLFHEFKSSIIQLTISPSPAVAAGYQPEVVVVAECVHSRLHADRLGQSCRIKLVYKSANIDST